MHLQACTPLHFATHIQFQSNMFPLILRLANIAYCLLFNAILLTHTHTRATEMLNSTSYSNSNASEILKFTHLCLPLTFSLDVLDAQYTTTVGIKKNKFYQELLKENSNPRLKGNRKGIIVKGKEFYIPILNTFPTR